MNAMEKPVFEYLRLSVTDRCNLRCVYCMPPEGIPKLSHEQIMRYEEMLAIVRSCVSEGVHRIRITGGEPLVRKGLCDFIESLAQIPGIDDISLTTNGILLADFARNLRAAGVARVNISLDSLQADRYAAITRGGDITRVMAGIEAAIAAGLAPVKINTVMIPGRNDDEVEAFGKLACRLPVHVRFIERMPFAAGSSDAIAYISQDMIVDRLAGAGITLDPAEQDFGGGPSENFSIRGEAGHIGFISSRSHPFCSRCTRLRLTVSGKLLPCLDSSEGVEVRGLDHDALVRVLRDLAIRKHARHKTCAQFLGARCVSLSDIGG
ncbi:MAG: Cyclic pyranopterin monophosphate synthase [bacterium ADurb.Bin374]|nr:MAG: Cyclic pyranopterin monophosphate synthase [bacterium ADurb.Bin374]